MFLTVIFYRNTRFFYWCRPILIKLLLNNLKMYKYKLSESKKVGLNWRVYKVQATNCTVVALRRQ